METYSHKVKTTVLLEKGLLDEIDQYNPFPTRKDFLNKACKTYLHKLKRRAINDQLATDCAEAADEDAAVNEEWEPITFLKKLDEKIQIVTGLY
jgi:hypothetical protein